MGEKKSIFQEGVELIASDIPKNIYPKDIAAKVSLLDYKLKDWSEEEWMRVVDKVLDSGYDYFPKIEQLREIHDTMFKKRAHFNVSCGKCFTGLRRYMAEVEVFDFLTRTLVKRGMPCVAACSSCTEGLRRNQEEGFLFYNVVMKRKDTRPMPYDESENYEEVKEMVRNSKIGMEPEYDEELPF